MAALNEAVGEPILSKRRRGPRQRRGLSKRRREAVQGENAERKARFKKKKRRKDVHHRVGELKIVPARFCIVRVALCLRLLRQATDPSECPNRATDLSRGQDATNGTEVCSPSGEAERNVSLCEVHPLENNVDCYTRERTVFVYERAAFPFVELRKPRRRKKLRKRQMLLKFRPPGDSARNNQRNTFKRVNE